MKDIVTKAQQVTEKVREHLAAAETFLAEDREVNGCGVFQTRWGLLASIRAAQIELKSAEETLLAASAWPGPADYDEA